MLIAIESRIPYPSLFITIPNPNPSTKYPVNTGNAYKNLLDKGEIEYEDIKQAYMSWMGNYAHVMSKKQVKNMKKLYKQLFKEDLRWKAKN